MAGPVLTPMPIWIGRQVAGAHPFVESDHGALHFDRRADGFDGVEFAGVRRAEERHQPVADVFVERAAVFEDDLADHREILVEQIDDQFRRAGFGKSGEVADVGEQGGHFLPDASESDLIGRAQDLIYDLARQEAFKTRTGLRLFLEPFVIDDGVDRYAHVDRDGVEQVQVVGVEFFDASKRSA